ncbi:MAG: hypothetical protein ACRELY_24790, partial [Polyangiaceae bacterium]
PLKIQPLSRDDVSHHKPGFFVLRNTDDWDLFFADPSIHPVGIDFSQSMVLAAYGNDSTASALQFRSAGDTGDQVNVFVTSVTPGDGCPARQDHPVFALATIDKRNEPVQFYVGEERGPRCDVAPLDVKVSCRVPPAKEWTADKLTAPIGSKVECSAFIDQMQRRTIADRDWSIRSVPRGSDTRLSILDEARKSTLILDALGTFELRLAGTDEAGRTGEAIATIEAPPASSDLYAELVWSNFTSSDDPDTFPRIELHANEAPKQPTTASAEPLSSAKPVTTAKPSAKGLPIKPTVTFGARKLPPKSCAMFGVDRAAWCVDVAKYGKNTLMRLKGSPDGQYDLSVHYTDDRFPGAPIACIRTYVQGKAAYELCDNHTRKADETWDFGIIEEATGKPESLSLPVGAADAGAPVRISSDAGK